jgi:hypothetical protein
MGRESSKFYVQHRLSNQSGADMMLAHNVGTATSFEELTCSVWRLVIMLVIQRIVTMV